MKTIQRYSFGLKALNAAAGVYTGVTTATFTSQFNMVVNFMSCGHRAYDSVTSQGIELVNYTLFQFPPGTVQDPGLVQVNAYNPTLITNNGQTTQMPIHAQLAAGDTVTLSFTVYLRQVTANLITVYNSWCIGYLCPEDYLSVESFNL